MEVTQINLINKSTAKVQVHAGQLTDMISLISPLISKSLQSDEWAIGFSLPHPDFAKFSAKATQFDGVLVVTIFTPPRDIGRMIGHSFPAVTIAVSPFGGDAWSFMRRKVSLYIPGELGSPDGPMSVNLLAPTWGVTDQFIQWVSDFEKCAALIWCGEK